MGTFVMNKAKDNLSAKQMASVGMYAMSQGSGLVGGSAAAGSAK